MTGQCPERAKGCPGPERRVSGGVIADSVVTWTDSDQGESRDLRDAETQVQRSHGSARGHSAGPPLSRWELTR